MAREGQTTLNGVTTPQLGTLAPEGIQHFKRHESIKYGSKSKHKTKLNLKLREKPSLSAIFITTKKWHVRVKPP